MAVDDVDDDIEFAVVEEVSDGEASADVDICEAGAFDGWHQVEFFAVDVSKEQRTLGPGGAPACAVDAGVDVAVCDDDVLPAVVVEVEEGVAPAEKGDGRFGDSHLVADVGEVCVAVVAVERVVVVGEGGVVEVDETVVPVVAEGDAHGGSLAAVFVEGVTGGVACVLEGAVAFVEIEIVRRRVVGDEEIGLAVVVDIDEERGEAIVGVLVG